MEGFGLTRDRIINKLKKGEKLEWHELLEVFSCNDKAIAKAVHYLLIKLDGESRDLLVDLINEDFKIWPHYSLDCEEINPICFDRWKFVCVNRETKRFLLNFAPETVDNKDALSEFKNSLINDILSK